MKKIFIYCDRCGKEITGYPLKLTAAYASRTDDAIPVSHPMPEKLKMALMDDCARDYCDDCMTEILAFAHHNMDAETFTSERQEQAAEEEKINERVRTMTEQNLKRAIKLEQRERIEQLYASGMSERKISEDMGIEKYIVRFVIKQLERAS